MFWDFFHVAVWRRQTFGKATVLGYGQSRSNDQKYPLGKPQQVDESRK